jgi:hypothetical protein
MYFYPLRIFSVWRQMVGRGGGECVDSVWVYVCLYANGRTHVARHSRPLARRASPYATKLNSLIKTFDLETTFSIYFKGLCARSVDITNRMQTCNRIYFSKIYWRLNMFRAAHRSSSGALNCICSLWFIYTCGDRTLSRLGGNEFPPICNLVIEFIIPKFIEGSTWFLCL